MRAVKYLESNEGMGWNKEKLVLSTWLPCTHVTAMSALCLPIAQGRMASARRFRPGKCAVNGYPSVTSCAWGVRMDVLLNLIKEDSLFFAHLYEYITSVLWLQGTPLATP